MSVKAVSWALDEVVDTSPAETLVLFALADFADNEGVSWHPLEKLAKRARCSTRTLRTHFKRLEELGLLSREPRYTWCKDVEGACAGRPAHKHRSGTTYRLHLEVTGAQLRARIVELKAGGKSTGEKFSPVEETAEFQGKVHRGKSFPCEGDEGSTVENLRSPQRKQSVTICNIEPSIKPPILSNPKKVTTARENDFSAGRGWDEENVVSTSMAEREVAPPLTPGEVSVDAELVMACIPEPMRTLDAVGVKRVWRVLEPLLSAGAKPGQIRDYLNSGKLPEHVNYMPGLIISRLERMALPKASTRGLSVVAPVRTNEPEKVETLVVTPEDERVETLRGRVDRACGGLGPGSLALVTNGVITQVKDSRGLSRDKAVEVCLALSFSQLCQLAQAEVDARKRGKKLVSGL